jgi:lipopolysaccharide transport system permease protein
VLKIREDLKELQGNPGVSTRDDLPLTIYTAESPLRRPIRLLSDMSRDLVASHGLAWRLFIRDMRAQYRNSLLGYVWVFIPPLVMSLPFIFLQAQGVIDIGPTPLPYGAYAMLGTTIWQVFVDALNGPLRAVSSAQVMLTRIKFPAEALLLAGLLQVGFNFVVRLLLLVGVFVWYGIAPPATAVLFPVGVFALVVSGFALGLLLTPLGVLYGDVQRMLPLATGFLMLLTPVIYPKPHHGLAAKILALNPLTPLVTTTREWLTSGFTTQLTGFLAVTALALVVLIVAWIVYRVALPHIIARLGS